MTRRWTTIAALLLTCTFGCGEPDAPQNAQDEETDENSSTTGKGDIFDDSTMFCAAIRGNGDKIPAHFGALARIVEHYGPIDGASGGSSGSITTFMLSSIQLNPLLTDCGGERCEAEESRNREALLLKSFHGYLEVLATTEEAMAARAVAPLAARVQEEGIEALLDDDPEAGIAALETLLESDDLRTLINPELLGLLQNSPNPAFHARDIVASIQNFGSFSADDPAILLRPGVIDFSVLADRLGVAASFYAGYGGFYDEEGMSRFLDACATPSRGEPWEVAKGLPAGDVACGQMFGALLNDYREQFRAAENPPSRADDLVGSSMPALISTSVLTGDGVLAWQSAREQYLAAEQATLDVNFDDVQFGYFGSDEAIGAVQSELGKRSDPKSQKFHSLGQVTWREALSFSPAEPGLARALEIDAQQVSAGGWSDLHPVAVLEDLGCDEIIYVTREGDESGFARGVATLLGMSADQEAALYDLDNPQSSYAQSVASADAVWCTDWDSFEATDIVGVTAEAYGATLVTTDEFFLGEDAYPSNTDRSGRRGCDL